MALEDLYEQTGQSDILDEAIQSHRHALVVLTTRGVAETSELTRMLANLTGSLLCRYKRFGDVVDLHQAISASNYSLDLEPPGHPSRTSALNNAAAGLQFRYSRFSDARDLEAAITCHKEALSIFTSDDLRCVTCLNNLSSAL